MAVAALACAVHHTDPGPEGSAGVGGDLLDDVVGGACYSAPRQKKKELKS